MYVVPEDKGDSAASSSKVSSRVRASCVALSCREESSKVPRAFQQAGRQHWTTMSQCAASVARRIMEKQKSMREDSDGGRSSQFHCRIPSAFHRCSPGSKGASVITRTEVVSEPPGSKGASVITRTEVVSKPTRQAALCESIAWRGSRGVSPTMVFRQQR